MDIEIQKIDSLATDFFFLASYSCLPTVVDQLNKVLQGNKNAVIFCFNESIHKFLLSFSMNHKDVDVLYMDTSRTANLKLRSFLEIFQIKRYMNSLIELLKTKIPNGSNLYFYNRTFNLLVPYLLWNFRETCTIIYAECDPVEIFSTQGIGVLAHLKRYILHIIYPIPFNMMRLESSNIVKAVPNLSENYFDQINVVKYACKNDLSDMEKNNIYTNLVRSSRAEVLWLMQPFLDLEIVRPQEYEMVLQNCINIINLTVPSSHQAVKFHPRSQKQESVWDSDFERIPGFLPAEFLNMPYLGLLIAVSSTAISGFSSNVKVISLLELIPFVNEGIREMHRNLVDHFAEGKECYLPKSYSEFEKCVQNIFVELGNPS
jgi:hypothetical protein